MKSDTTNPLAGVLWNAWIFRLWRYAHCTFLCFDVVGNRNCPQQSVKICNVEFQSILCNGLWGTWKSKFMAIRELYFIMDQNEWKSELLNKFLVEFFYVEFQEIL
jgi:hypothetical protein